MSYSGEAALRGEIGVHARLAKHDGRDLTAAARQAFLDRFRDEVDPDRSLAPAERERRAKHALKAHMSRLALRSAQERRKRAEQAEDADLATLAELAGVGVGTPGGA